MTSNKREHVDTEKPRIYYGIQPKNLKRSEDLTSVCFVHPGISYCMLDRNGHPTPTSVMVLIGYAAGVVFSDKTDNSLFGYDWYSNGDVVFVLSTEIKFNRTLYKKQLIQNELITKITCIDVGSSSMKVSFEFFLENDPEPVIRNLQYIVNIDVQSRRPKPVPSWMSDSFRGKRSHQNSLIKEIRRPENTFIYRALVTWSDTDFNDHCNFTRYGTFAGNAVQAGLKLRDMEKTSTQNSISMVDKQFLPHGGNPSALKGISQQMVACGIKDYKCLFFRECLEGDVLNIHLWQDEVNDNVVFCSIEKENKVICQIIMEYFTIKSNL